ncbi:Peptide methionine sulfoxide reductase A5 [Orobanche minor]
MQMESPLQASYLFKKILKVRSLVVDNSIWHKQLGEGKLRMALIYRELRPAVDKVRWREFVLNNIATPRAQFIIWLVLRGRIASKKYDPAIITHKQLLDVFWTSHDSRQLFGQGPDVGNQYRFAAISKEREQTRSKSSVVTTQIQQLVTFYPAELEHQKFELKRNPLLLHLIGNLQEEELERSSLATKLNIYAVELCPPRMQSKIDAKINDIVRNGWPILRAI